MNRSGLEELTFETLRELNWILDEVLRVPDSIFRLHGTSAFTIEFCEQLGQTEAYREELDAAHAGFVLAPE